MKVLKAMKKLKFWSRKKKKKNTQLIDHPPLPPPPPPFSTCHCAHSWLPVIQPSAPPLPPWFEYYEQSLNSVSAPPVGPDPGIANSSGAEFTIPQEEIVPELNSVPYPTSPPLGSSTSYQQYTVPNPVYGVPVVPAARREEATGFFGCVVDIGRHLIRCLCPCFHIREVD